MKNKLATATLAIGAMILSATGYAADSMSKPSVAATVKENVGDAAITSRINAAFVKDREVSTVNVIVHTDDKGVVTLSGKPRNRAEADKAVKIATETRGVTSVRNNMTITGANQSMGDKATQTIDDALITTKINAEFAKDKDVSTLNIVVHTNDKGIVTLSGNAKSSVEAAKAVRIARATKGVSSVRNEIKVQAN
jgi:hyperosmotically inducible protein